MGRIGAFLLRQFLPAGLGLAAAIGILLPEPGRVAASWPTQHVAVSIIFVCAGLRLRTDEIKAALSAWRATAWGVFSVLLVTPVLGVALASRIPVDPAFQLGLALFFCMPTTLSSGIALTGQARGNVALALLLTVLTNVVGIFSVPFVLTVLLSALGNVELSAADLLAKLCVSILLPLALGRFLRTYMRAWVDAHRASLGLLSNTALICIPWMKFSESSARLTQIGALSLVMLVCAGVVAHVVFLTVNAGAVKLLRLDLPERKAVILLASQKTLPVALTVLAFLPVAPELKGLVAIPCVTSHLGQILVDAVVATRWRGAAA